MATPGTNRCPVCEASPTRIERCRDGRLAYNVECPNCGFFQLTTTAYGTLAAKVQAIEDGAARLSHALRRMQGSASPPCLGSDDVERIIENTPLPNPQEQADNLILWLGSRLKGLGDFASLKDEPLRAVIGAWHEANVGKLIEELASQGVVKMEKFPKSDGITLTFSGWRQFQQLRRASTEGRRAFMAMPYGHADLDRVYMEYFKPAVQETGFELLRLDERPEAGLIDNRMRAQIRTARFLIAELTHANLGAYWEAGFAEGLGKPVIYSCEKNYFDEVKTHFDANHSLTVVWSESDLAAAAETLKATIRNTLPTEAEFEGDDTPG